MPLTRKELIDRLSLHEDSFVERKLEGGDYKPTLVAFANSVPEGREAVLYLGVRDDGEVAGVSNPDTLQKKIQRFCAESCYPPLSYTAELLPRDGKVLLAIVITSSKERPHFSGPAWTRRGSQNIRADAETYDHLVTSRHTKAAELLKYLGKQVTVLTWKNQLGHPECADVKAGTSLHGPLKQDEYTILDVNPFFVRLEKQGRRVSEMLRNIDISYDEKKWRPILLVHLDGA